ncbi:Cytochrome P450 [Trichoderma parareesei]|uniref:Cytochrome P450 n=1 Tax=Trichoderma parareesei TaxID=858221 RepID=A0A2H2Z275_TRIPA|nr:Cytochrome P450 [Trichoderma parareesei]
MALVPIAAAVLVAYGIITWVVNLRYYIKEAKRSGLPYIVTPCNPFWLPWQVSHKLWVPIIKLFPRSWWDGWLEIMIPNFAYRTRHEWFAKLGESFLIASPGGLLMMTDNAETIRTVTLKREHFPKWTAVYSILRQFGENVLTTEGSVWRMHRKVTSASFNERNAALVFREAINQTQGMLRMWTGPSGETRKEPLRTLQHDTMKLALNIISYVGFGMRLLWPGETHPAGTDPKLLKYGSHEPTAGHKLSFTDTMELLLHYLLLLLIVPRWILRMLPFENIKKAVLSYDEYVSYMNELLDEKIDEARKGEHVEGMDLMGQLAKSSFGTDTKEATLTRDEIIGNAFIMFVAGHETTANAIHFTIIYLATHPEAQRAMQRDIDDILGGKDPQDWDYDSLVNPMTASMIGAAMYETLRLVPAVSEIPKKISPEADESFVMDGTRYVLPKGTGISLVTVSTHVNPRYWPTRPSKITPGASNILDYCPDRWFQKTTTTTTTRGDKERDGQQQQQGNESVAGADAEDFGGFQGSDINAQLFKPERGSYIPFSDGARSCLGRRIAVVEIIAALAVIFRSYSVELAVDEWAKPDEVEAMGREERARLYRRAQDKSRWTVGQASTRLTLNLHDGMHVPVRIVRRGEEKFVDWVDRE